MKKLFLFLALFVPFFPLQADVLPKPHVEFSFIYNTEDKPLIDGLHSEQIQCEDNLCVQSDPLGSYGIQKMTCGGGKCEATAYRFEPYQKLIISFTDGTKRESDVFELPSSLYTRYNVYVEPDKLIVEPSNYKPSLEEWFTTDVWFALFLVLLLELAAAAAFLVYKQKPFTILYAVAVANVLTTLLVWVVLPGYISSIFVLWILCVLLETAGVWAMNKKRLTVLESLQLCFATNVTSYALGMILSFIFA